MPGEIKRLLQIRGEAPLEAFTTIAEVTNAKIFVAGEAEITFNLRPLPPHSRHWLEALLYRLAGQPPCDFRLIFRHISPDPSPATEWFFAARVTRLEPAYGPDGLSASVTLAICGPPPRYVMDPNGPPHLPLPPLRGEE